MPIPTIKNAKSAWLGKMTPTSSAVTPHAALRPTTPTSGAFSPTNEPPEFVSRPRDLSDDDEDNYAQQRSGQLPRKKGGYDSRIEQILYENSDLQIVITNAGKSQESGGSYIVYTIRTGVCRDARCKAFSSGAADAV
ncbi:MAG: hypothetical protein Q9169_000043 [Polycauliona sp. 2 TL-2023]